MGLNPVFSLSERSLDSSPLKYHPSRPCCCFLPLLLLLLLLLVVVVVSVHLVSSSWTKSATCWSVMTSHKPSVAKISRRSTYASNGLGKDQEEDRRSTIESNGSKQHVEGGNPKRERQRHRKKPLKPTLNISLQGPSTETAAARARAGNPYKAVVATEWIHKDISKLK